MRRSIHFLLLLVLTCRIAVAKTPSDHGSEPLQLNVRVFNYAPGCSGQARKEAQAIASRIFYRAGIEVRWVDCSLSGDGTLTFQECTAPLQTTTIILRLVPTSPATRAHFGRDTLGIAAQAETGTDASASVFHDRVKQLAAAWLVSLPLVLGHAMAHEIGHLLLGAGSHSPGGLMREHWKRQDLTRAAEGNLLFNGREAGRIRTEVRKRRVAAEKYANSLVVR